jgi:hypothetical protein
MRTHFVKKKSKRQTSLFVKTLHDSWSKQQGKFKLVAWFCFKGRSSPIWKVHEQKIFCVCREFVVEELIHDTKTESGICDTADDTSFATIGEKKEKRKFFITLQLPSPQC